ncbi:hypothetical protein T210_0137740 [Burkholderia pseudomallei MSHR6137]|nr:hypothetical protein T210_0137740 [Burkholderia pseudomallei MSHR6137]
MFCRAECAARWARRRTLAGRACIPYSRATLARESMRLCETGNRTRSSMNARGGEAAGRRSGEAACGRCAATVHDGS